MLTRTPFKRKPPPAYVRPERVIRPNGVLYRPFNGVRFDGGIVSVPKENAARSDTYRRLVAAMPCIHCGRVGHSQAAHADRGKGAHIKTDDRTCFPLCCSTPGFMGCHDIIGASGAYTRDQRRDLEVGYGTRTRAAIFKSGNWPAELEYYP